MNKPSKDKAERLFELFIHDYITKTQYFEMMERINKSKENKESK